MSAPFPPVEVALATYNGAQYLSEQLSSIAAQHWPHITIVATDDGSTDATAAILSGFTARPLNIAAQSGGRGVRDNFAAALAATTAPYVFLSDQDDWWEEDKVPLMMGRILDLERLHGRGHPVLATCNLSIVDVDLRDTGEMWFGATSKAADAHALGDLVLTGHVPGCAMAMNRALLDRALPIPRSAHIHDWWLAQTAAIYGTITHIDRPLVRYRQHSANTLGAATAMSSPIAKLASLLRSPLVGIRRQHALYRAQAEVADGNLDALRLAYHDDLPASARQLLADLAERNWYWRYHALGQAKTAISSIARAAITWHMRGGRVPNAPWTIEG